MPENNNQPDERPPLSSAETGTGGGGSFSLPHIAGYEIVRLLGEGGMGAVYEALQDKPHRRVALKVLRHGLLTPALLRRFNLEVEILGRLEHPAIAHIYDAGSTGSGDGAQPYFAMEFIEGLPITRYVRQHGLTIRDQVQLLIQVAEGVQHAHQKGVIHRDLKPANIFVDARGQPKILDFGVARATESDLQITILPMDAGILLGTLAYMSPEQTSGDATSVDIRSDVYALGMLAYEVLTGRRPYRIDPTQLHDAILTIHEREPPRLSSIKRELKGDLEIIVHKAIEKDKERRYPSAAAMSDDFQRFLRNEPISARPPSAWYQIGKFARRHKSLVGAGIATFLALAAGLALATIGLVRARHAEEASRRAESQAIHERERAESNLKKALDTVDQFTTHAARRQLADIPEAEPVREHLLRDAIAFYEQLAADNEGDSKLREELSWALTRMAESKLSRGDLEEARKLVEQRINQLTSLLESDPHNSGYLRELARSWSSLGRIWRRLGQLSPADEAFGRAILILRSQAEREPDNTDCRRDLAHTLDDRSSLLAVRNDLSSALKCAEESVAIGLRLSQQYPEQLELQRSAASSWMTLGRIQARTRDEDAARTSFTHAHERYAAIVKFDPNNPEYQIDLARCLGEWGAFLAQTENPALALPLVEQAGARFRNLVEQYPNNADYQRSLARNWDEQGRIRAQTGAHKAAFSDHSRALVIFRKLADQYPQNPTFRRDLARNLAEVGQSAGPAQESDRSTQAFEESYQLYSRLLDENPTSRDLRMDLAYMLGNWALQIDDIGASTKLNRAQEIWSELSNEYPRDASIRKAQEWTKRQLARRLNADASAKTKRRRPLLPANASVDEAALSAFKNPNLGNPLRLTALETERLRDAAGQYAIVQGRILSIEREVGRNQLTFLRFGTARLQFNALIHRNVLPAFLAVYGENLGQLVGQEVEIEGLLSVFRETPQIALNRTSQIRLRPVPMDTKQPTLRSREVEAIRTHVGMPIFVEGRVSSVDAIGNGSITFVEFENKIGHKFTAIVRAEQLATIQNALGGTLSQLLPGRLVRLSGVPYLHRGNPNMDIRSADQIEIIRAEN